jgi:hypothetical protein
LPVSSPLGVMLDAFGQPNAFTALAKARTVAKYLVVDKLVHFLI